MRIQADSRVGKLGHVGLADDGNTGAPQPCYRSRIVRRGCRISQYDGTGPRDLSLNIEQILDRDDVAVERREPRALASPFVGGCSFLKYRGSVHLSVGASTLA